MADTLSVTDMLPNKFEPKRKFRFLIDFTSFGGGLQIMATKCSKPTYELTGVTEHRVLNHQSHILLLMPHPLRLPKYS